MQAFCILQAIVLIIIFDIMASVGWRNPSESLRGIFQAYPFPDDGLQR